MWVRRDRRLRLIGPVGCFRGRYRSVPGCCATPAPKPVSPLAPPLSTRSKLKIWETFWHALKILCQDRLFSWDLNPKLLIIAVPTALAGGSPKLPKTGIARLFIKAAGCRRISTEREGRARNPAKEIPRPHLSEEVQFTSIENRVGADNNFPP